MSQEQSVITLVPMEGSLSQHKYTSVYHEKEFQNNAPHHYFITHKEPVMNEDGSPQFLGTIDFQDGPILEAGVNGVNHENLLAIVANRLEHFQNSEYATRENALALNHIQEALMWLGKRTADRELRNVEGTHEV